MRYCRRPSWSPKWPRNIAPRRRGSALADRFQLPPPFRWDLYRAAGRPVDDDVDEITFCGGIRCAFGKDSDPIADARSPEFGDGQANLDGFRKFERRDVGAPRFDDESDWVAIGYV